MLNSREILILQILMNEKIDIRKLSKKFSVSESTIRYNIRNINSTFDILKIHRIKIRNNIVELEEKNDNIKNLIKKEINIGFSKEERLIIYIFKLFFSNAFNITRIADLLFVSRMTVKNDLYELERLNQIKYICNSYKIVDDGNINDKINSLYSIMKNNKLREIAFIDIDKDKWENVALFINQSKDILEINFNLTDMLYIQCLVYIMIFNSSYNSVELLDISRLKGIDNLEQIFEKLFGLKSNFNLIIDILLGLSLNYSFNNWINESIFVKKLIYSISKDIGIDLTKDKILFEFLCFHIKSCIYRLRNNLFLESFNYIDLVEKDNIYDAVRLNLYEIERVYEIKFNEEEILLISFHINSSIERQNKERKRVVLVCGLGYGTSKILSKKLNEIFDVDIVDTISMYELKSNYENYKSVDYIISTINIDFVNSIKISPLLNNDDQEKLIKCGLKINRKKINLNEFLKEIDFKDKDLLKEKILEKYSDYFFEDKSNDIKILFNYFTKEKVIFLDEYINYKAAIFKACEPLIRNNSITIKYYKEILELILEYGSYMVLENKVAIVHASSNYVNKNDVSIVISKKEIIIGDKTANIIICFATLNDNYHKSILSAVLNILDNDLIIEKIVSSNNIDELKKIQNGDQNYGI